MQFDELICHVAAYVGTDTLAPGADGAVHIAFGDLVVHLRPATQPDAFTMDTPLRTLKSAAPSLLLAMMSGNRWPQAAGTGVLAITPQGTAFLVRHFSGPGLSGAQLVSDLERFARRARQWRAKLAPLDQPDSHAATTFTGQELLA